MQAAQLYEDRSDAFKIQWWKQACKSLCTGVWDFGNKMPSYDGAICYKTEEQEGDVVFDVFTDIYGVKTRYKRL